MTKDPIKITVGLGFAGVLTLMGLISLIALSQMNTLTNQSNSLLEETNAKISAANTMRDSIRLRGNTLHKMYLTDDYIDRDEYRLEISEHALRYKLAKDKFYSYHISAREAKLLDRLTKNTRDSKQLNDIAADNLLSDLPLETIKRNLQLANNARQKMMNSLNELVLLEEENSRLIIEDTKKHQKTIISIAFYLSLAAFFIAVYIAQRVIREASRKNSEIHFQATHDELTKLVNRKEFNNQLQESFSSAKENHDNHALCFIDLDKFKTINDSCGHKAGDELLIQLTNTIKDHIRSHDTLARIGGDEFGLLLTGCSLEKASEIAEGIVSLVKNYQFNWQDQVFHVGVSIGISAITHQTQSVENALSQADIACYAAKDMGRGQVQTYGLFDNRTRKIQKELSWVSNINDAANSSHFSLHLQAIKALKPKQSISMYEVLLRLNDDEGSLVSPGSYISTAERFSLMKEVDRWVIDKSFRHLSQLYRDMPHCDVRLFINISANSLSNQNFSDFVIRLYKKYNIQPDAICFEISEINAVKNINRTADIIKALHKFNIKFALDEYGTEMPSFSYLKNLPVDYLKISGDIIKNMARNTTDKAMVAAINQVGKVMHIKIIAKHVENVFTLNQLKEIGIDYGQGFYLDKPTDISTRTDAIKALKLKHSQQP
jgi:diguanylate cyclase (GGDEF)-like protein